MKNLIFVSLIVITFTSCDRKASHSQSKDDHKTATSRSIKQTKPKFNIYIENSGSMDGYVKGITEFEQAVYGYLSDIKISGITDSMNLFYINSKIIPQGSNISDFIEKLEPTSFQKKGGNRQTSDLSNVFKSVLSETTANNVAIWITDGIFSPGKGKNAQEYLVNQQIGIKNIMASYLKKYPKTGIIIYQLSSKFNGYYYNNVDSKILLNGQRPYYIWIIGNVSNIINLKNEVPASKFNGKGVNHTFTMISGANSVKYCVKENSGSFSRSRENPTNEIIDLTKDRDGMVRFGINVDFSEMLLDDEYIFNASNYEVNNYQISARKNNENNKYTHHLTLTSNKVRNGVVNIKLKMQLPSWLNIVNDDSGVDAIPNKTYGIKYQIKGIYEAYTNKVTDYTTLNINIK